MIIDAKDLKSLPEFQNLEEEKIQQKLDALEILIRQYTHNNFQNRNVRFTASCSGKIINGSHPFIKAGDTIQISKSQVNDGLYVVKELTGSTITVDKEMFSVDRNLVTKIEYPLDVQQGIIELMKWEVNNREKVGIKSETLSRHSVTYYDMDVSQVRGYPASLLGFLESYKKARF